MLNLTSFLPPGRSERFHHKECHVLYVFILCIYFLFSIVVRRSFFFFLYSERRTRNGRLYLFLLYSPDMSPSLSVYVVFPKHQTGGRRPAAWKTYEENPLNRAENTYLNLYIMMLLIIVDVINKYNKYIIRGRTTRIHAVH